MKERIHLDPQSENYDLEYRIVTRIMVRMILSEKFKMSEERLMEFEEAAVLALRCIQLESKHDLGVLYLDEEPDAWNSSVQDEKGDGDRPDDGGPIQRSLF